VPSAAISTQRLRKVFGDKIAVRGLTLDVRPGEVFGFLGPNGAGKSTSLKMLLGLVKPTRGSAEVLGRPIGHTETRKKVGFLPEHFRFHEWMTGVELLHFHGRLYGVPAESVTQRVGEMLETVGLTPHGNKQLRHFSKGMQQRIGLAQALINEPEVLFLDEPTSGLDPVGRRLVRDIIKAQRERGTTIFLNSHVLGEVEVICDRVAFIKAGEVVELRAMSSFEERRTMVTAQVRNVSESVLDGLSAFANEVVLEGERLRLRLLSPEMAPLALRHLVNCGAEVFAFTPSRLSLEDRFIEILGRDEGL
jgi:ABC-2 type transport system ATP-binding protein